MTYESPEPDAEEHKEQVRKRRRDRQEPGGSETVGRDRPDADPEEEPAARRREIGRPEEGSGSEEADEESGSKEA